MNLKELLHPQSILFVADQRLQHIGQSYLLCFCPPRDLPGSMKLFPEPKEAWLICFPVPTTALPGSALNIYEL